MKVDAVANVVFVCGGSRANAFGCDQLTGAAANFHSIAVTTAAPASIQTGQADRQVLSARTGGFPGKNAREEISTGPFPVRLPLTIQEWSCNIHQEER